MKHCTYPDCKCPFDMDSDNKCLINLPQKDKIDEMNQGPDFEDGPEFKGWSERSK